MFEGFDDNPADGPEIVSKTHQSVACSDSGVFPLPGADPATNSEQVSRIPTYELIGQWIDLVNEHGRNSQRANTFYQMHSQNKEFCSLVETSDRVRIMFEHPIRA